MRKLSILFFALLIFAACKSSKKGAWVDSDKKEFSKSCEAEIQKLKDSPNGKTVAAMVGNLDEFAKKSCDCSLQKLEQAYESPKDAQKDNAGITKIGQECGKDVMLELMKNKAKENN
ncbi:MAG: hypothetical protein SFU27_04720 [Thermonemataceae bacterium]|nr:hypothetical protein [Thermonemataceae bacterium]